MALSVGLKFTLVIFFLNSNEEIVVRNPKCKRFFFLLYIVCCLVCCVLSYKLFIVYTFKVAKLHASEKRGLHSPSQL